MLTPEQGRVLGCLVEKQLTTPHQYPLTDNALIAACNQTTSRDPVVQYDLTAVRVAIRSLREQGLARTVHRSGERSDKHQHELPAALDLSPAQVAVLAVLLLRGPQTAAELRVRTERMHPFGSVGEVEDVLAALSEREPPLVARLPRQPGRREDRYDELLVGAGPDSGAPGAIRPTTTSWGTPAGPPPTPDDPALDDPTPDDPALDDPTPDSRPIARPSGPASAVASPQVDVAALSDEVARLRAEVAALRSEVAALRDR
jgi:uncharacterized protein